MLKLNALLDCKLTDTWAPMSNVTRSDSKQVKRTRIGRWLLLALGALAILGPAQAGTLPSLNGPIPDPFPVGSTVHVSCDHRGNFKATIATELELSQDQAGQLRDRTCAAVYGALVQLKWSSGKKNPLETLPFVAVEKVKGNPMNALYDRLTDRVEMGVMTLNEKDSPLPVAVFVLGHELGHKLNNTYLKETGVRVAAGAVAIGTGVRALSYGRSIKGRLLGLALSAASTYVALCPSSVYAGELSADRFGYAVLKNVYLQQEPEADASRYAYDAAVKLFEWTGQVEDEKCMFGTNEKNERVLVNANPHPSTTKRIANLNKLLSK